MIYKQCRQCGENKDLETHYEKGRNFCRECSEYNAKQARLRKKQKNPVLYKCNEMASSAYSRVYAPSKSSLESYRDIEEPFGFKNSAEMRDFLYENFKEDIEKLLNERKKPSLSRIDLEKGYTRNNIQIMELKERLKGNNRAGANASKKPIKVTFPTGEEMEFESTKACSIHFKTYESTVWYWLNGINKPKNGCKFEYIRGAL